MKYLVEFLELVTYIIGIPGDNSNYVEGKSRYIWMPDGKGYLHLVDLHEPVDNSPIHATNGAHNQYWLFTRRNPSNHQVLTNGNANSIRNSNYAGNRATKVVVHGWKSNGGTLDEIVQAFLYNCDCNVISLDWSTVADQSYNNAVSDVPSVGQHLGNFIQFLFNTAGGNFGRLHLVGHSLGAHVVGNAGRALNRRARRVTGLDPAGPQWGDNPDALGSNAGQYVEAIHTDGRALGIFDPSGHADFYPNGGVNPQPGCVTSICSHRRAVELFAATVQYNYLVGRLCNSLYEAQLSACKGTALNMGNDVMDKSGCGLYGLRTGRSWPF